MLQMDGRTVSLMFNFTKSTVYFMLSFQYTLKLWPVYSIRYFLVFLLEAIHFRLLFLCVVLYKKSV